MNIIKTILVFTTCAMSFTVSANTATGSGKGPQSGYLSLSGQPLLKGFKFNLDDSDDHHIKTIKVRPTPFSNNVDVGFFDKGKDDRYNWKVDVFNYRGSGISYRRNSGTCTGFCNQSIDIPFGMSFVITDFELSYSSKDHHIDQISVWVRNGILTLAFNDKDNNDKFFYNIGYALVPSRLVANGSGYARGTSTGSTFTTITQGNHILSGFSVDFLSGDHELNTFGVELASGSVRVSYFDQNFDDLFNWHVDYVTLR